MGQSRGSRPWSNTLSGFSISDKMSGQEERSGGLVETQPFRNASMVQAEPKSILSFVEQIGSNNLIATATSGDPNPKAYRNNPTCLAEPKSIWNIDEKGNSEAKKLITPASGGPDKNDLGGEGGDVSEDHVLDHLPLVVHPANGLEHADLVLVPHPELHHDLHGGGTLVDKFSKS